MKLYEMINYFDIDGDFDLRVNDENVGKLKELKPIYYEVYRNYNVSLITQRSIHIHNDGLK